MWRASVAPKMPFDLFPFASVQINIRLNEDKIIRNENKKDDDNDTNTRTPLTASYIENAIFESSSLTMECDRINYCYSLLTVDDELCFGTNLSDAIMCFANVNAIVSGYNVLDNQTFVILFDIGPANANKKSFLISCL